MESNEARTWQCLPTPPPKLTPFEQVNLKAHHSIQINY
jgi:hypothetical protein